MKSIKNLSSVSASFCFHYVVETSGIYSSIYYETFEYNELFYTLAFLDDEDAVFSEFVLVIHPKRHSFKNGIEFLIPFDCHFNLQLFKQIGKLEFSNLKTVCLKEITAFQTLIA
jgi:hypothetical protein